MLLLQHLLPAQRHEHCFPDSATEQTPVWGKDYAPEHHKKPAISQPRKQNAKYNLSVNLWLWQRIRPNETQEKAHPASATQPVPTVQQGNPADKVAGLDLADAPQFSCLWEAESAQSAHSSQALLCLDPRKELLPFNMLWLPGSFLAFLGTNPDEPACRRTLQGWLKSAIEYCSPARSLY